MKEKYVPAEMEIINFEAEDIITTSGLPGYDGGNELPDVDL